MNIIIIGCGRVGRTLAGKLNDDGNDVTVIDMSAEKVKKMDILVMLIHMVHDIQTEMVVAAVIMVVVHQVTQLLEAVADHLMSQDI